MFQLSKVEAEALRSQIATSNDGRGGRRYAPYVFTEQGVAMLSGVLRSDRAIAVNIEIMRAFVELRRVTVPMRHSKSGSTTSSGRCQDGSISTTSSWAKSSGPSSADGTSSAGEAAGGFQGPRRERLCAGGVDLGWCEVEVAAQPQLAVAPGPVVVDSI